MAKVNLGRYLSKISREERLNVKYVVIDMWEPYLDIASIYFPDAIVAIDS
ncbi:MAG: transposase, partial [Bacilli bacterium]|nr:transposase [Bacilli bacterium]